MNAYDGANWIPLFGAVLAAAAALVELVIGGISINLSHILSTAGLTGRAAEPIIHLVLGAACRNPALEVHKKNSR